MSAVHLEVDLGDGGEEKHVDLQGDRIVFGRARDCGVRIFSDRVSRHHLLLLHIGDKWIVQDLDSSNGTYLNQDRIAAGEVRPGDVLRFGENGPIMRVVGLEPQPRVPGPGAEPEAKRYLKLAQRNGE